MRGPWSLLHSLMGTNRRDGRVSTSQIASASVGSRGPFLQLASPVMFTGPSLYADEAGGRVKRTAETASALVGGAR